MPQSWSACSGPSWTSPTSPNGSRGSALIGNGRRFGKPRVRARHHQLLATSIRKVIDVGKENEETIMETAAMGRVLTEAKVENLQDLYVAQRGLLQADQVRA